ncbi:MAG: tetratricopeptide repeat protein [Bacteroidetes bacterium]|nr:tetratricopeptide repeat protein [Bacteroidota bacterium]
MKRSLQWIGMVVVLCLTAIVYADHFHDAFHLDDVHTIVNNAYIRDLRNVPLFFADGRASSSQPANQTYRPLLTTSLALDYRLGAGTADTLAYHITSFCIFLCLGLCLFLLLRSIYGVADSISAPWLALLATAWYLLHPLSAETVCYIIQRGDLMATFFIVFGLLLYVQWPAARRYYLYLLPIAAGILAKPIAVAFAPILLVYTWLYEGDRVSRRKSMPHVIATIIMCVLLGGFVTAMTPRSYDPGTASPWLYRLSQPYVLGLYFAEWFAPLWLAADHAMRPFEMFSLQMMVGFVFVLAVVAVICFTARVERMKPIAFGLLWYLVATIPTSIVALNDIATDHRMFLPAVGLAIALTWAIYLAIYWLAHRYSTVTVVYYVAFAIAAIGLTGYSYGAWLRTQVWRTDESLWADAVAKYPESQPARINYALALMNRSDWAAAEAQLHAALTADPTATYAYLDMGIVKHEQGNDAESGAYLQRAIETGRDACPPCYYYYAMYLNQMGQTDSAIVYLYKQYHLSAGNVEGRELLMELLYKQQRADELRRVTEEVLAVSPDDGRASYYAGLIAASPAAKTVPATAESYLDLSGQAYREGRYQDCIDNAKKALELKPDFAEGYNNLAAANNKLGKYAEAKKAAEKALRLDPHSRFAQINMVAADQGLRGGDGK